MVSSIAVLSVALLAVGLVLTPGPNTVYLVTRTISQGRSAGMAALLGIATGSVVYLVSSAAGAAALLILVPHLLQGIKAAGTTYLLWLAWHTLRTSPLVDQPPVEQTSTSRLFLLGWRPSCSIRQWHWSTCCPTAADRAGTGACGDARPHSRFRSKRPSC